MTEIIIIEVMEVLATITRIITVTVKNTVISPNLLVWKFYGKAQFPHSFERITRNYAETLSFHKISKP